MYFLFKRMTEESAEELEEMAEKIGEATTSETGEVSDGDHSVSIEGTSLEGATINVVVDGVTPSTGITGTIGVSVDEKA